MGQAPVQEVTQGGNGVQAVSTDTDLAMDEEKVARLSDAPSVLRTEIKPAVGSVRSQTSAQTWRIKGIVSFAGPIPTGSVELKIFQLGHLRIFDIRLNSDGKYNVEITSGMEAASPMVTVVCEVLGHRVAETNVFFQDAHASVDDEGNEVWGIRADLKVPAQILIYGRVKESSGIPAAGARVGLFEDTSSGVAKLVEQARTDQSGRFVLACIDSSPVTLAVVHAQHRPELQAITPTRSFTDLGTIRLSEGLVISGALKTESLIEEGHAVDVVKVNDEKYGSWWPGEMLFYWGEHTLAWEEGELVFVSVRAACSSGGGFSVAGLVSGKYRVRYDGWNGSSCLLGESYLWEQTVEAPSSDVLLRVIPPLARIDVVNEANESILDVDILQDGQTRCIVDDGRIFIGLHSTKPLHLTFNKTGYDSCEVELGPAQSGDLVLRTITLHRENLPGEVSVEIVDGAGFEELEISVTSKGRDPDRRVIRKDKSTGLFLFDRLPAGEYSFDIRLPINVALGAFYCFSRNTVTIESGRTAALRIAGLQKGGKVQFKILTSAGRPAEASCLILDLQSGQEVQGVEFVSKVPGSGAIRRRLGLPLAVGSNPGYIQVLPALPQGNYLFEFALEGYQTVTRQIQLETLEVVTMDITLLPAQK